ncbi:hypothetical protein ACIOUE_35635 [Streptomyces xanthochromogenes]|uniref:hypothetical protein n=1 Tax=Streptomyces xanthochromogenes TaxID=67384 RepID=UPI0037FA2E94
MPDSDSETNEQTRGLPLTPLDEAHLARAQTLTDIASAALDGLTAKATQPCAAFLSGAQELLSLAERLVDQTVIVHRERGESWETIGEQAGISRQAAHDRWAATVGAWTLTGRRRTGINAIPADILLPGLDEWYQQYDPARPRPVSATLDSSADPAARLAAQQQREEAAQLRAQTEEPTSTATREAWVAYTAAVGTGSADEKRAAWAAAHLTRATLYDRLAAAEGPMGAEAKRAAGKQRSIAREILDGSRDAQDPQPFLDTYQRINAAWNDLSTPERTGSPKEIAEHIARRLDGVSVTTVSKHLDRLLRTKAAPLPLNLSEATDEATAREMAQYLVQFIDAATFWAQMATTLLTGYLMAAALDDASLDTVHRWSAHPDDAGFVELLRTGCSPESPLPADVEAILSADPATRHGVLATAATALQHATEC